MADEKQLRILRQGPAAWNAWRQKHRDSKVDLSGAILRGAILFGANLLGWAQGLGVDQSPPELARLLPWAWKAERLGALCGWRRDVRPGGWKNSQPCAFLPARRLAASG